MRKILVLLIPGIFIFSGLFSQNKQLTIKEAVIGQWRNLYPEHLSGVQPYDEDDFSYMDQYTKLYKLDGRTGDTTLLYSLEDYNALKSGSEEPALWLPFVGYKWISKDVILYGNYKMYDIKNNKELTKVDFKKEAKNITRCDETGDFAYTIDNNLFVKTADNKDVNITSDKNKGIVNGDGYVHRQEFGIHKGIFWSPKGKRVAFYRKDETMVTDYPLVDITKPVAEYKPIKYPMAGQKSEEVTLGIYSLSDNKTVFADVTDFTKERYLTSISWDPSGKYIYIGVLNRDQNHLKLNKYNAETGAFVKTLFEEKNKRYVEPENHLYFSKANPEQFIWYSERSGYNHLYLYNTKGELLTQLTKGNWAVTGIHGFDSSGKNIYITATKDSPIESHTYKVNLKKQKITKITNESGVHRIVFSKSKKYQLDTYSNKTTPNNVVLAKNNGSVIKEIITAENPLSEYNIGDLSIGIIKAADDKTDLYYRLITPPDFDPNKKYPAIVYVYGGPHAQMVTNSWLGGARLWSYFMAQKGYVMLTVDNRGSANRGFEFESIIHRNCGQVEMKDQKRAIDFLLSKDFVDKDRLGIHGWSYGGFMTISMMTNYPDLFKAGVAGGPVIDWKYYEIMYGERYMDTPQENPDGYKRTSLLNKAESLKGRLLIIHGYQDPVVVPQNSLDFKRAMIKAGTDADFFFYPESEHNMRGQTRVHLMKKVTRYFDDFLK